MNRVMLKSSRVHVLLTLSITVRVVMRDGNRSLTAGMHPLPSTRLSFDSLEHRHLRCLLARRAGPAAMQSAS
jgi:hypothetical protein